MGVNLVGISGELSPREQIESILRRFNLAVSEYISQSESDLPAALAAIEGLDVEAPETPEAVFRAVHMSALVALLVDAFIVAQGWGVSYSAASQIALEVASRGYNSLARDIIFPPK